MNSYGFLRMVSATSSLKVADCYYNILKLIADIRKKKIAAIMFPELSLTGYNCANLSLQRVLLRGMQQSLCKILDVTKGSSTIIIVRMSLASNKLYNVAVVICGDKILGAVPKTFLPNYNELYKKHWISPFYQPTFPHVGKSVCRALAYSLYG